MMLLWSSPMTSWWGDSGSSPPAVRTKPHVCLFSPAFVRFWIRKTCRVFRRCVLNLPWRQTFSSSVDLWLGARDGSDRVQLGFQRRAQSVCVINSLSLFSSEAQCFLPSMPIYGPLQTIIQIIVSLIELWIFIWLYWCLLYKDLSFHPTWFL